MLYHLTRVSAFGGLSEAVKGSFAQHFYIDYGPKVARYDEARSKIGKNIYALPEKEQALWLHHELEQFSNRHYWLEFITLESLHRDAMTM